MNMRYVLTSVLLIAAPPSFAGPCAPEIDKVQSQLDARLETAAAKGPTGTETTSAKMHRQPTPATIGAAEEQLGDISAESQKAAESALARARKADSAGQLEVCERDLAAARKAIAGEK